MTTSAAESPRPAHRPTEGPGVQQRFFGLLGTAGVLALLSGLAWFVWLGWDDEYEWVDGVAHGPYEAWQVIACGATVVALTVVAYVLTRGVLAYLLLPVAAMLGFAVPWTGHAASSDESGLYVVGLFLLLVGGTIGLWVVLGVTAGVVRVVRAVRPGRS